MDSYTQIAKEEVDRFRSSIFRRSSIVPSCELHIRWDKNQEPPFLNGYHISLKGTADRNDYFKVSLNPSEWNYRDFYKCVKKTQSSN